jgi:hypothetical protein
MTYQIYNNGAFIRIVSESGERRIMKQYIVEVRAVNEQTLKIDVGDPLSAIYINQPAVTDPSVGDAATLRDLINIMITGCVCKTVPNTPG